MYSRAILSPVLIAIIGCQASAGAKVKSTGQLEAEANAQATKEDSSPGTSPKAAERSLDGGNSSSADASSGTAMLGARAGLRLKKPESPNCQCLGVFVGTPDDSRLAWEGAVPSINPATQIVVGLSSEGLDCPAAAGDSLGASYQGYSVSGSDVVVQVETARLGRPIAQGAIVPRPPSGGRILVRAADKMTPYGRSVDGKSNSCRVWTAP